ncbi:hypothetical protein [Croceitalea rosinachiae]|uniref:Adhesin domain-containing protein n=1 Tax=Croceitalea rosinachiae TaxID=3075596 RepID=A0ABU3A8L8_9FLAO|nr:hypothetical protein [Croceitalea sp. F388]MDT0606514.1 hypothetical protein [Croceitalea sp. F388]
MVKKVIANPDNQYIFIDTKNCYQVNLKTIASKELVVKASIEGEYLRDLVVKVEDNGKDVFVSAGFLPNFIAPNDKLSAHKVISISLDINIPQNSNVQLFGTNSILYAEGNYKLLQVSLADGDCTLNNIIEKAEVKTQKGNIVVIAKNGTIEATSTYGEVSEHNIPKGFASYILKSVEGDIQINKTE